MVEQRDCPVAVHKELHWLYGFLGILCFLPKLIIFLIWWEVPPLSWTLSETQEEPLERDKWQQTLSWGGNSFNDDDMELSIYCFETIRSKFRVLVTFLKLWQKVVIWGYSLSWWWRYGTGRMSWLVVLCLQPKRRVVDAVTQLALAFIPLHSVLGASPQCAVTSVFSESSPLC